LVICTPFDEEAESVPAVVLPVVDVKTPRSIPAACLLELETVAVNVVVDPFSTVNDPVLLVTARVVELLGLLGPPPWHQQPVELDEVCPHSLPFE
jgi:hypothetical protein